jgi:hypothetical protein
MKTDEYDAWSARYCAIFIQDIGKFSQTLAEWRSLFEDENFTLAELNAALTAMAKRPPGGRWDHHAFLLGSVRNARAAKKRADLEEAQRRDAEEDQPMNHTEWQVKLAEFRRTIGKIGTPVTQPKPQTLSPLEKATVRKGPLPRK